MATFRPVRPAIVLLVAAMFVRAAEERPAPSPAAERSPGCIPAPREEARHAEFLKDKAELKKQGAIQLVFIGDSITDYWHGGDPHDVYVRNFGIYNPYNIGVSGDQTQNVLWRIDHGELDDIHPKAAVVLIGTNNLGNGHQSPEQTADGISCVVNAVHQKLPDTRILLLGIFPRGHEPTDPFRAQIATVNKSIARLDGKDNVRYLDINAHFLDNDGKLSRDVFFDFVHPNTAGYKIWAAAIKPVVDAMQK